MTYSEQMSALQNVRTMFGKTGFTEDHEHYRRVGFTRGAEKFSAIGETWKDAIDALKVRASQ